MNKRIIYLLTVFIATSCGPVTSKDFDEITQEDFSYIKQKRVDFELKSTLQKQKMVEKIVDSLQNSLYMNLKFKNDIDKIEKGLLSKLEVSLRQFILDDKSNKNIIILVDDFYGFDNFQSVDTNIKVDFRLLNQFNDSLSVYDATLMKGENSFQINGCVNFISKKLFINSIRELFIKDDLYNSSFPLLYQLPGISQTQRTNISYWSLAFSQLWDGNKSRFTTDFWNLTNLKEPQIIKGKRLYSCEVKNNLERLSISFA